jgi:hypothetical protein
MPNRHPMVTQAIAGYNQLAALPHKKRFAVIILLCLLVLIPLLSFFNNLLPFIQPPNKSTPAVSQNQINKNVQTQTVNITINPPPKPTDTGDVKSAKTQKAPTSTPIPKSPCSQKVFPGEDWDMNNYRPAKKDGLVYDVPSKQQSHDYVFPLIPFKDKVSALFDLSLLYRSTHQTPTGTQSAVLHFALKQGTKKLLEINTPAANRSQIEVVIADVTMVPTPIRRQPITLPTPMSLDGEHTIELTTYIRGDEVIYVLSGLYKDINNRTQSIPLTEIPIRLSTIDPTQKDFNIEIGTGKKGMLSVKEYSFCNKE